MQNIFIVGSAGKVGLRLVKKLKLLGHVVHGLYRHDKQFSILKNTGAIPIKGNLTTLSEEQLAEKMADNDVVVFTAGAGGAGIEVTNAIDGTGLELTVNAAKRAGIRRFILVSVFPEAARNKGLSARFENYMSVKKTADAYLVATDLDWVILRPGTLSDEQGSGNIAADLAINYGSVTRDDVAATLAELINQPNINHKIIELTQGETPIAQAISKLAFNK
ncbi:MAG: nucleoside-diphosphate-sugar epimerase [Methylophagaceae bacterium]|jgi:nucleoside-diphosphate-sugar epimerase